MTNKKVSQATAKPKAQAKPKPKAKKPSARAVALQRRMAKFLSKLAETGNVSAAADVAGWGRTAAYTMRDRHPEFKAAWDEAVDKGLDALEEEARRRAYNGVEKPVFYKGKRCGGIQEYSDTLLIFLLKNKRRDEFGDHLKVESKNEVSGSMTVKGGDALPARVAEVLDGIVPGAGTDRIQ